MSATDRQRLLEQHFTAHADADAALRPIFTSLNGDNSWLMSFPRPEDERKASGKAYYHILFEPWLAGPTSQLSSWFIHIRMSALPAATDAEGVVAIIRQIERAAAPVAGTDASLYVDDATPPPGAKGLVDVILLGFDFLDHTHEPTLALFDSSIPVVANREATEKAKAMNHFDTIQTLPDFAPSSTTWQIPEYHNDALPSWLRVIRLPGEAHLNYCLSIIWSHTDSSGAETHEAIFQTPHGTTGNVGPLQSFLDSHPPTKKLALLHALKEGYTAGSKLSYGVDSGLALYRRIDGAKYWLKTHDSTLWYSGIMMRLLWVTDYPRTLQSALDKEAEEGGDAKAELKGGTPNFVEAGNGGLVVLA